MMIIRDSSTTALLTKRRFYKKSYNAWQNEFVKKNVKKTTIWCNLVTVNKGKEDKRYWSNEWLTYVKLAQRGLLWKDNNDPGHVAHHFAGCFACDDDTFPDGYSHLDESQARVWHQELSRGCHSQQHGVPISWEHRKS